MHTLLKSSFCLLSFALLTACVPSQNVKSLESQVYSQQQTIQSLNQQISNVQPAQADAWLQMQSLRQEIASLRGIIDNLELALRPLGGTQALGQKLVQHDKALRTLESQFGLDFKLDEGIVIPMNTGINSQSFTPDQMGQTGQIGQIGQINQSSSAQKLAPSYVNPSSANKSQANLATKDTAQALYDTGITAYNERRYQQAVNAFSDFISTYPKHSSISNAYYWQGDAYYQLKNYAQAALAYEEVISAFPNSTKAPSAYLKQAMSFANLQKPDAAKERYNQLISAYPKAPEATRAKQLIKEL